MAGVRLSTTCGAHDLQIRTRPVLLVDQTRVMTRTASAPVVLVPGHWLGGWAWDEVVTRLTERGVTATAVTLPGRDPTDPHRARRTLEDQAQELERIVTAVNTLAKAGA